MQLPGSQVHGLARLQDHPVEQQDAQDAGVRRIALGELRHRRGDRGPRGVDPVHGQIGHGPGHEVGHDVGQHDVGHRDERGEHRAQALGVGLPGEHVAVGPQRVHVERVEQGDRALDRAESHQRVELSQGDQDLGIVIGVAGVAVSVVDGAPPGVLRGVALARLLR